MLKSGDHVVVSDNVYGGTFRLFERVLTPLSAVASPTSTPAISTRPQRAFTPATRLLFVETPSNPVMRLTDLRRAADLAHRHGAQLVVDNTFASPYIQRPIELGADLVMHSTTKYLNGHSDSVGGVVIATRDDDIEWLKFVQNAAGAILSPVRLVAGAARHQDAAAPDGAAQRERPGAGARSSTATRRSATSTTRGCRRIRSTSWRARQMRGFGGMLAFDLGSLEAARHVC